MWWSSCSLGTRFSTSVSDTRVVHYLSLLHHSSSSLFLFFQCLSDPAVYPYSLQTIYPTIAPFPAPAEASMLDRPVSVLATRKVVRGHVRKSSWKRGLPPVPPIPDNVLSLTAFSGKPLPPVGIEMRMHMQLPLTYPNVHPCMFGNTTNERILTPFCRSARVPALRSLPSSSSR